MRPLLVKTLVVVLVSALVLAIIGSGVLAVALRPGIAPEFDQRIALDAQHSLVLHAGPQPNCTIILNPHSTTVSGQAKSALRSPCIISRRRGCGRWSGLSCDAVKPKDIPKNARTSA